MKKSNLLYIFINISLLIAIIALNYFADPYFIFNKARPLHISRYLLDEPYIPLKLHKNKKYDYVIVGGSTTNVLELGNFNKNLADISCFRIKTQDMGELLFNYLNMHPETKTVYLALDFRQLADTSKHTIPKYKEETMTTRDWFRLLLSGKTIYYSLKKITNRIPDYPVNLVKFKAQTINMSSEEIEKTAIKSYGKIFKILKEKKIKAVCFILPTHANRQIYLEEKIGYQTILNIKKFIISQNGYLIDMSTLNKFTSKPLKDSFYLFSDLLHGTNIYGYFVYNILLDTDKKDTDLYKVLTIDNIDTESKKEKEKIALWKKEHIEEYDYYINGLELGLVEGIKHTINDVPAEFRSILNYKKSIFYKN